MNLQTDIRQFMATLYEPLINPKAKAEPTTSPNPLSFVRDAAGRPVLFDLLNLLLSMEIVGGTGKGKSWLARALIRALLVWKRLTGNGFCVIDPHGTLATWTRDECASRAGMLFKDVIYVDLLQAQKVVCLDTLSCPTGLSGNGGRANDKLTDAYFIASLTKEALLRASGTISSADKPSVSRVLGKLSEAMILTGLTLVDGRFFLNRGPQERAVLRYLIGQLPEGDCKSFWTDFDAKTAPSAEAMTLGPANRLAELSVKALRRMLGQTNGIGLNFKSITDDGAICIFNTSREGTGVTADGQRTIQALIVQNIRQTMETRTPDTSRPFIVVCDEVNEYIPVDLDQLCTGSRKRRIGWVFIHHNFSQLVGPDGDRRLLDGMLAVPNKIIFGGLPFDQCKVLAEQTHTALLNPDKIKFQVTQVSWDPVQVKDVVRSSTRGGGEGSGHGHAEGTGDAATTSISQSLSPDGLSVGNMSGSARVAARASSDQYHFTSQRSWSQSEQDIWRTEFLKRETPGAPIYESIEEQVFRFARRMNLNPPGTAVFTTAVGLPQEIRIPRTDDHNLSECERETFMRLVHSKPVYLDPETADRLIEERQAKLIEAAPVPPKPKPKRVRRNQPFIVQEQS